jgi:hypothetical protein
MPDTSHAKFATQGIVTGCSGRPSILTRDHYEETMTKILSRHAEKRPVSRQGKRITLIACVAADGSYLRPAVIIPRKTYDDYL